MSEDSREQLYVKKKKGVNVAMKLFSADSHVVHYELVFFFWIFPSCTSQCGRKMYSAFHKKLNLSIIKELQKF
jgi:hypothetical protein